MGRYAPYKRAPATLPLCRPPYDKLDMLTPAFGQSEFMCFGNSENQVWASISPLKCIAAVLPKRVSRRSQRACRQVPFYMLVTESQVCTALPNTAAPVVARPLVAHALPPVVIMSPVVQFAALVVHSPSALPIPALSEVASPPVVQAAVPVVTLQILQAATPVLPFQMAPEYELARVPATPVQESPTETCTSFTFGVQPVVLSTAPQ